MKRILAALSVAAILSGTAVSVPAADPVQLSPRASAGLDPETGYLCGFDGIPDRGAVASQFASDVVVTAPDGRVLGEWDPVPADSVVTCGGEAVAKVLTAGDCDRSGTVGIGDVAELLRHIAGWNNDICIPAADADKNGRLNLTDAATLLKYAAGWDVTLDAPLPLDLSDCVILANDPARDYAMAEALGAEICESVPEGSPYVTAGEGFSEKYPFMDRARMNELFRDSVWVDTYGGNVHFAVSSDGGMDAVIRFLASSPAIPKGYVGTLGALSGESARLYGDALSRIAADGTAPGYYTSVMSEDILTALENAEYTEPQNIIYMIGDGMGFGAVNAADIIYGDGLAGGTLAMKLLPVKGSQTTYSASDVTTDSAAGATALSTGFKTANTVVGMDPSGGELKNLVELAAEKGKSTGIVVTKSVTNATPAAFTAHAGSRDDEDEIARQQLACLADGTLDLVMGGGFERYLREVNQSAMNEARAAGVRFAYMWEDVEELSLPFAGLFSKESLATAPTSDDPSVAEMTELALERLSEDEDGFFLMIEGSQIDTWGHSNSFADEAQEVFEFDCAVAVAMKYVAMNPDTVLVITADHETGGLIVDPAETAETVGDAAQYLGGCHFWSDVPVYAVGYGTGVLAGQNDNVDLAIFLAELMGEGDFGMRSRTGVTVDFTDAATAELILSENPDASAGDRGIHCKFGGTNREFSVPFDSLGIEDAFADSPRVLRLTVRNCSDGYAKFPNLYVDTAEGTYQVSEWWTYIDPGKTVTFSYVLPREMWDGAEGSARIRFTGSSRYNADLEFLEVSVSERPDGK